MSLVFNQPLFRIRPEATTDRYGNAIAASWESAPETPIGLWAVDAGNTAEDVEARDSAEVEYTVRHRGDLTVVVRETDRIRWRGLDYTIVGKVQYQPGPSKNTSHSIIRIRRVEG